MEKVYHTYQKFNVINTFKWTWREFAPFKIFLTVLYSVVWIWGLTGKPHKRLKLSGYFKCHWPAGLPHERVTAKVGCQRGTLTQGCSVLSFGLNNHLGYIAIRVFFIILV